MKNAARSVKRSKVAVLTNIVPTYRYPIFAALARQETLDLRIFVSLPIERSTPEAQATLPLHYSPGINLRWRTYHRQVARSQIEPLHIPLRLFYDLARFRPQVIISGELGLRSLGAWLLAKLLSSHLVIWTEEITETARSKSGLQHRLRRFLIPRTRAFLAWGEPAADYLRSFDVPDRAIYLCAQAVDNDAWLERVRKLDRNQLRAKLGFHGRIFLSVSQLINGKGIDLLISAWLAVPQHYRADSKLVIVGRGSEAERLKQQAGDHPDIVFAGYQPQEQLADYYAAADVFIFPSLIDVWGLVVNEAMVCGLPVLASKYAGASQGLVQNTGAGEVFDPADHGEFTALLQRWCTRPLSIEPRFIRSIIAPFNFDVSISAMRRVILEKSEDVRV